MKKLAILAALLFASRLAQAEAQERIFLMDDQVLGLIDTVEISMTNQATEGCWTNSKAIEQSVRLKFEQSGIAVEKFDGAARLHLTFAKLSITGIARRTGDVCFGSMQVKLSRVVGTGKHPVLYGTVGVLFDRGGIAANSGALDDLFAQTVDQLVTELAADVLKARRDPKVQKAKALLKK